MKIIILSLMPFLFSAQKMRVFMLAGQSNMNGFGYTKDLPKDLKEFKDVYIFQGNTADDGDKNGGVGKWDILKPGHGTGFKTDGRNNMLSDRFGLELSLAKRLKELFPKDKIALIKYAKEGTSIDSLAKANFGCWEPEYRGSNGINQYDHFLKTLSLALEDSDIDKDGKKDEVIPSGILWMQGESDGGFTKEVAEKYYGHLNNLINLMRASLRKDDIPVVIGKISDSGKNEKGKIWAFGEIIQEAEEKFAKTDKKGAVVRSTKNYKYSDNWHYDSAGYIDLGEKFAEEVFRLITK
ncbi:MULTISPECIES: sialate O-acetylesterase [unclassified Chryseobacterium]|uniref:sialate O-acetylesterase n=1 Tax=unclassified Chryseobacterium TaxID=2593645 RepID=UPI000E4053FE|nr:MULTISPECIES: sialate O-acetylesterase [unclassified Chryseobacterium]